MHALIVAALALTGCGRIGFDNHSPTSNQNGDATNAGGEPGTTSTFTFSDDFDAFPPSFAKWDGFVGGVAVSSSRAKSPPSAMDVMSGNPASYLHKRLTGPWSHVDCSFQVDLESAAGDIEVIFLAVAFSETTRPNYGVSVHLGPAGAIFYEGYDRTGMPRLVTNQPITTTPTPNNVFESVRIVMPLGGGSATVNYGATQTTKLLDQASTVTSVQVRLGHTFGSSNFVAHIDDLFCTLQQ